MLGVSRGHLRQVMKLYDIDRSFTAISDDNLESIIREYKQRKPKTGLRYIRGYLLDLGLHIPKERVRMSLQRVDPLSQTLRRREVIQRRTYEVPRPNYLWHIDGHHKMIRWGFVVHGITDGYCRTVSGWICGVCTILIVFGRSWACVSTRTICRPRFWCYSWRPLINMEFRYTCVETVVGKMCVYPPG